MIIMKNPPYRQFRQYKPVLTCHPIKPRPLTNPCISFQPLIVHPTANACANMPSPFGVRCAAPLSYIAYLSTSTPPIITPPNLYLPPAPNFAAQAYRQSGGSRRTCARGSARFQWVQIPPEVPGSNIRSRMRRYQLSA